MCMLCIVITFISPPPPPPNLSLVLMSVHSVL